MIHRIVIGIAVLLIGCASDASFGVKTSHGDPNLDAVEQYDFAKADTNFSHLIAQDSGSAAAHYGLGFTRERQLLYYDAIASYLKSIAIDARFAPAYRGLARSYAILDADAHALDAARKYADLLPTDVDAQLLLVESAINTRNFADAGRAIDKAVAAGLNAKAASLTRARIAHMTQDAAAEEAALQQAAGTENSAHYLAALASYLETSGNIDSAVAVSGAMYRTDRSHDHLVDHFLRASRVGYSWEARQLLEDFGERDKTGALKAVASYFYYATLLDRKHAAAAAESVYEICGGTLSAAAYLFHARSNVFDMAGAGYAADELAMLARRSNLSSLIDFYRGQILKIRTPYIPPMVAIWHLDSILSPVAKAEESYLLSYAHALSRGDTVNNSNVRFVAILNEHAKDAEFIAHLAKMSGSLTTANMVRAESLFTLAMTANPKCVEAFDGLTSMYLQWNHNAKALAVFEAHPYFAERYPLFAMRKAQALASLDRPDDAVVLSQQNLARVAGNSRLLNELIRSLVLQQRYDQANQVAALAVEKYPNDPDLLAIAAFAAGEAAKWQEASSLADRGLKSDPSSAWLQAERARAQFNLGKKEDAKASLLKLTEDLANTDAQLYFSRILAESREDDLRAQDYARQAAVSGQVYHRAMFNLAHVYLITARYDLARGAAQAGLQITQNDPEGYYLLGMALYNEANPEARSILEQSITLGLKGKLREQAQATLSRI